MSHSSTEVSRPRPGASPAARFTTDLDTATDPGLYAERLSTLLALGWEGLTGRVVARDPARPAGIPDECAMTPFDVKLSCAGKPWCTVAPEVGGGELAGWTELRDVSEAFGAMGSTPPEPDHLMQLAHQVAQKIHAVTGGATGSATSSTCSLSSGAQSLPSTR